MVARLQRLLALALIAVAAGWAAYLFGLGHPVWACAGAGLLLFSYAFFLAIEFGLLYFVQNSQQVPRPSAAQLLCAWAGEAASAPRVFFWRQPFRSNAEPDNLTAAPPGQRAVVLVHGFVCNRGFWNPWMRELRARHVPFIAVNLEPVFGSIDHYPQLIEAAVTRLEGVTALPVLLVGHSMGGLAIRAWLTEFSAEMRVARVITIGSPHRGTWLARFGHTTNGRQMRLECRWLTQLAAREGAARRTLFTCFFGHCDNIVFPAHSGTLEGAKNLHLAATAHVHMAFQKEVFSEVLRWLTPEKAPPVAVALAK